VDDDYKHDYAEIVKRCEVSRDRRREHDQWMRLWYTRGTDAAGPPAKYNRLEPHVDRLASFLYTPEGTRFFLHLPPEHRDEWLHTLEPARDEFMTVWRTSGADMLFAHAVEWGLVKGCSILKLSPGPNHAVEVDYVEPGSFGVLSEYIPDIARQEAFVHWFVLTMGELERMVRDLPNKRDILALADSMKINEPPVGATYPKLIQQIIVTSVQAQQVSGFLPTLGMLEELRPENDEPIVELAEVWVKEDYRVKRGSVTTTEFRDYEVTTMLGPEVLFQRRNPVFPWTPGGWESECPFIPVTPRPVADYFWGKSEIQPLIQLQQWREDRMADIDILLKKQLDPPRFFSGVTIGDDKLKALSGAGGYASTPLPGAKMDVLKPEMPENAFSTIREIDRMFDESSGIPEILQGTNAEGVRAGSQASTLAGIGAGRIRKRALITEDSLEVVATRMFHLMQRRDPTPYNTPKGRFLLSQLPPDIQMKVSAHTSSPVYQEQVERKVAILLKAGAITLPKLVELLDPPGAEALKVEAQLLQDAQSQFKQKVLEIQLQKAMRGRQR